ncbi:MAG: ribosome silencing factor [Flavobacteriales bacterium]|jgi:ribosome-associated protein|nr:ribosome silencing factor [Flavobacteriales bacterium]
MIKKKPTTDVLLTEILHQLSEIKAKDITIMDMREIDGAVCSYFVLCTGGSTTHVRSIAGAVEKEVSRSLKEHPWHVEGTSSSTWVLMDYADVVVHVFEEHTRAFYDIESLWGDAHITHLED